MDLAMPPGKLAAQAGHAYLEAFLACQRIDPTAAAAYAADPPGTKVALAVPTESALCDASVLAGELGLPAALITDRGHVLLPHFTGAPIVTALGIGPVRRSEVRRLTRRFALVP
jgi:peptidyl-tRNA hydrolase